MLPETLKLKYQLVEPDHLNSCSVETWGYEAMLGEQNSW